MMPSPLLPSIFVLLLLSVAATPITTPTQVFICKGGQVDFKSDAPLELIEAQSQSLEGVIDASKGTFAFRIPMRTFQGFNSPLQQEHFNENYLETARYPTATFKGKILEDHDLTQPGEYTLRAKGLLYIHGRTQERIIKSQVRVHQGQLHVTSRFTVLLEEHDITIPKIVYQKIAEEIEVRISARFAPQ